MVGGVGNTINYSPVRFLYTLLVCVAIYVQVGINSNGKLDGQSPQYSRTLEYCF